MLQAQVRIGGKGTVRRKQKVVHRTATTDDKKVQSSLAANTFAVTGHAENKQITEMLPGILNQLGAESLTHLKRLASNVTGGAGLGETAGAEDDDDEVPDLVENFDEASKDEKPTEDAKITEETPDKEE